MTKTVKLIVLIALIATASVSCRKESTDVLGDEMAFKTCMADLVKASAGRYQESTLNALGEFKITGYDSDSTVFTDRSVFLVNNLWWKFKDNPTIWLRDHLMTFWASANIPESSYISFSSTTKASSKLTVTQIPESSANHWDPLVGYYQGKGESGTATIKFYHPFTGIQFKTGALGTPATITKINSVTLKGVHKSGYADITGTNSALSYTWHPSGATNVNVTFSGTQSAQPFLLIPQKIDSTNYITIDVNVTLVAGGNTTMTLELKDGDWKNDILYTYTLDYVYLKPMEGSLKVTLTDWTYIKNGNGKDFFDANFDDEN